MIARRAAKRGLNFSVGGRDASKVVALSTELGVDGLVLDADDRIALGAAVAAADCVINAAGPFAATARQVIRACLDNSAHYIDITGEVGVFELAYSLDAEARDAGVMLMPGAGWDVVPSDCIALHVALRATGAEWLRIGLAHIHGVPSRGTLRTGSLIGNRKIVRRGGVLVDLDYSPPLVELNFGLRSFTCELLPMGDVVTAFKSTGIPNIAVYGPKSPASRMLEGGLEAFPEGPTKEQNARWRALALAEAKAADGRIVRSVIETGSGYEFTAAASIEIAERIAQGRYTSGFQSPASAYGVSLATELGGRITDLDGQSRPARSRA